MRTITLGGLLACAILVSLILGSPTPQSFAAKPAPPPPPPPPPPIRYEIKFWDYPSGAVGGMPSDMNNAGQVVGWMNMSDGERHAYLYDDAVGVAVDLHNLYSGPGTAVPEGWRVNGANGINDDGVIVGKLVEIGNPNGMPSLPFILDPQGTNQIVRLPDDLGPDGSTTVYLRINNNWDILTVYINADGSYGAYFYNYLQYLLGIDTLQTVPGSLLDGSWGNISLNNPTATRAAQVSGRFSNGMVFRWTSGPDGGLETFTGLSNPAVRDINDAGVLCGETNSGKPSKRFPMRLSSSTPNLLTGAQNYYAQSINNSGDVLLTTRASTTDTSNLIFHNDLLGYFDLDQLVTGSDADVAAWLIGSPLSAFVNDRDSTGFGRIAGRLLFSDAPHRPFILTPVAP